MHIKKSNRWHIEGQPATKRTVVHICPKCFRQVGGLPQSNVRHCSSARLELVCSARMHGTTNTAPL